MVWPSHPRYRGRAGWFPTFIAHVTEEHAIRDIAGVRGGSSGRPLAYGKEP